jgi:hypothetical protein
MSKIDADRDQNPCKARRLVNFSLALTMTYAFVATARHWTGYCTNGCDEFQRSELLMQALKIVWMHDDDDAFPA